MLSNFHASIVELDDALSEPDGCSTGEIGRSYNRLVSASVLGRLALFRVRSDLMRLAFEQESRESVQTSHNGANLEVCEARFGSVFFLKGIQ